MQGADGGHVCVRGQVQSCSNSSTVSRSITAQHEANHPDPSPIPKAPSRKASKNKEHLEANLNVDERYGRNFMAGLFVGVLLAGAFNPVDKALYLSVVKRRPFLTWRNFHRPFEGLAQAMAQRTLSAGLYYPLYDTWRSVTYTAFPQEKRENSVLPSVVSGILTGASSGALLNAMSVVKYHNWGSSAYSQYGVFVQAHRMYKKGGFGFFHNGIWATICRDAVFGATYSGSKFFMETYTAEETRRTVTLTNAGIGLIAGSLGTAIAAPFNYARIMQYASPPGSKQPSILVSLYRLAEDTRAARAEANGPCAKVLTSATYIQARLRIGWGTLRVGLSMSIGQQLYDFIITHTEG